MFKNYSKDQRRVLLGACLYYMGLGGFLFNSQTSVLAAVRSLYQFPMTRISLYTTIGYVATILGATLMGPMIFRLSQKNKKLYFEGMYLCGAIGILILAFFAETPLFYLARFLMSLSVSTISIIISYILNQWIQIRTGTAIGIASAFAGVGGMLSNPLSAFLFETFSFQKGIVILVLLSACLEIPSFFLLFRKPVPEGTPVKRGRTAEAEMDEAGSSLLVLIILGILISGGRLASLFTSYLSMFSQSIGYSASFGATLASILMFGNISSKFMYGFLSDQVGVWKATMVTQLCVIIGVALFIFMPGYPLLLCIGTLGYGMMYGLFTVAINRMCMASFGFSGTKKYQGLLTGLASLAGAAASPLIGIIYDRTGSFTSLFAALLVLMMICFVLTGVMAKLRSEH